MHCTLLQETFLKRMQDASHFVTTKSQIPSLQGIRLTCKQGRIYLRSTDLRTGYESFLLGKIDDEGECVVPAKVGCDVLATYKPGPIVLSLKDKTLHISQGRLQSSLQMFSLEDFPPFPSITGSAFQIPFVAFKKAVEHVTYCASPDEARPVLTSVFLAIQDGAMTSVCTDGYRLSLAKVKLENSQDDKKYSLLLSSKSVAITTTMLEKMNPKNIECFVDAEIAQVYIHSQDTTVFIRCIEGQFPPYESIIPNSFALHVLLEREELMSVLKTASVFSRDVSSIITLTFEGKTCRLSASSATVGNFEGEVETNETVSEKKTIAFNGRFLLDCCSRLSSDRIEFSMNDEMKPALIRPEGDESLLSVIMPFKK